MSASLPLKSRLLLFAKPGLGLHAMITSAGCQHQTDPRSYDWHGLKRGPGAFALIQVTLSGAGMLRYEATTRRVGPGDVMLLCMPHDHRYWLPEDTHWRFFFVCLTGSEVMRAWHTAIGRHGPVLSPPAGAPLARVARRICRDVLRNAVDSPWQASVRAYELAMAVLEQSAAGGWTVRQPRPPGVQRVIDYCRRHSGARITVAEMARLAGFSRYHFTRLFTRSEGMSPREFLGRQRLAEAVRLMQTTSMPIKAIAAECGFFDAQYFCKMFRKAYGVSPGAFRRPPGSIV